VERLIGFTAESVIGMRGIRSLALIAGISGLSSRTGRGEWQFAVRESP